MTEPLLTTSVGETVANDFRTAAIFEDLGIDFCCGGRQSLEDACRSVNVDPADVARAVAAMPQRDDVETDVTKWPLDRLIDHIIDTHHAYVRSSLPRISVWLDKLVNAHATRHPELASIAAHFEVVGSELLQHMMKEEHVLFPYVRELAMTTVSGRHVLSPFGTVENPIRMMEREHADAADELRTIRELTNGYAVPADGCGTYSACMGELDRFERDLHRHVHLENNVLFPAAVALEQGVPRRT